MVGLSLMSKEVLVLSTKFSYVGVRFDSKGSSQKVVLLSLWMFMCGLPFEHGPTDGRCSLLMVNASFKHFFGQKKHFIV